MAQMQNIFITRFKTPLHVVQLVLVMVVIGIASARVFMSNQPRTRANTIALGMGSKSLIILQYQLLTEHVKRFKKWASLKAFAILNGLEIVFWAAVVFLMIQGNLSTCVGLGCTLSWVVVGLAIVLTVLATYVFGISMVEFRESKRSSVRHGTELQLSSPDDSSDARLIAKDREAAR